MRLFGLTLLGLLMSASASAEILYRGDFETGNIYDSGSTKVDTFYYAGLGPNCVNREDNYSAANDNRIITSPVRYGNYANAQTIRYNCDYRPLNEGGLQKPRQSLKILSKSLSMVEGKEYWLAFSFMLPTSWVSDYSTNRDNLFQLVKEKTTTAPDARKTGPNIVNIEEYSGNFVMLVDDVIDSNGNASEVEAFKWATTKGEWQDIIINFKPCRYKASCTGFMKIYVGNSKRRAAGVHMTPVYSRTGPNSKADLHTAAINLYKYGWHCQTSYTISGVTYDQSDYTQCMKNTNSTASTAERTAYFDEFVIGGANSSITEVAPYFSGGASSNEPAPPMPPSSITIN